MGDEVLPIVPKSPGLCRVLEGCVERRGGAARDAGEGAKWLVSTGTAGPSLGQALGGAEVANLFVSFSANR